MGSGVQLHSVKYGRASNIVRLLKACATRKDLCKGIKLHEIVREHKSLENNNFVACSLVSMYARCGALAKAQQVLKDLPVQDVIMWNAIIAGYTQQGHGEEALKCLDRMQLGGHFPNGVTFTCALKACGSIGAVAKGKEIHDRIVSLGMLEKNILLGSSLVDMYAKCGALAKAQQVLEALPFRNVGMWNALIASYTQQGQGQEALRCYDSMQHDGHSLNEITFTCVLKACGNIGAAAKGKEIHDKIVNLGMLEKNVLLGSTLVDMYAKCGELSKAQQVLEELPTRNVVSWSALMAGYVLLGQGEEALTCYYRMQCEGHSPDAITFICALKACGSIGAVIKGEEIHDKIVCLGMLEKDIVLGNTLVAMYTKCSALSKAQQVLKDLPVRSVVTWNLLIAGHAEQGQVNEALRCYDDMQYEGHSPNEVTFICALKACGSIGAAAKGKEIHDKIVRLGMLKKDVMLGSSLVDMYVKCGAIVKAQEVLEELPVQDCAMWSALIAGYAQQGQGEKALKCYDRMQQEGHFPNLATFICALKACGSIGAAAKGKEIKDKIVNLGMLKKDVVVGGALLEMYVKCNELAKAQEVLKDLSVRDVVMWNALISGYAQQGQGDEALKCYDDMQCDGQSPNAFTFTFALKACASIGAAVKGEEIHDKIVKLDMLKKDIVLGSTLVDMYAKCGALAKAQQVLQELPVRNVVTWNALIAGYAQLGPGEEALKCYDSMQREGHFPDVVTFTCALKSCASIGAAAKGEEIHEKIVKLGLLEGNILLGSTLVNMYARCGALTKAQQVFEELPVWDVVTWSALIAGYAQQGQTLEALNCFARMQVKGVKPDSTTLSCVLNACTNLGLLKQAEMLFSSMSTLYGIKPDVEHYCCIIDLLGRTGQLNDALQVIMKMSSDEYISMWVALLASCSKWGKVKIGRLAFECAVHLDKSNATAYVLMADGYRAAGMHVDAETLKQ